MKLTPLQKAVAGLAWYTVSWYPGDTIAPYCNVLRHLAREIPNTRRAAFLTECRRTARRSRAARDVQPTCSMPKPKSTPTPPALYTWWQRNCNGKRYFLRQVHDCFGTPFVWIYQEGVNRCLHIPVTTLLKRYTQLHVGPVDPTTGRPVKVTTN